MYSNGLLNSLKYCECDNNNLCSVTIMNKINRDKGSAVDGRKPKKDRNCNEYSENEANAGKKPVKTLEIRREEVLAIRNRFPNKIPVIVQKYYKESRLPNLDKSKYLVPQEITMSQFQTLIRNRIRLTSTQALYLLVNNKSMMSLSLTLAEVYAEHSESDGFLYITYASQEVFGNNSEDSNLSFKQQFYKRNVSVK